MPADYATFFTVMAGVGGTLFGLIFVVISIRPEVTDTGKIPVMRQVQIASSYSALLNPLVISLIALIPHETISTVTIIMSVAGLINTVIMGVNLLQDTKGWAKELNNIFFILGSTVLFGYEFFDAIRLDKNPGDLSTLSGLAILLVIIYIYGIARAWDLVGARQFHIYELFTPLIPKGMEEALSEKLHTESTKDAARQRD